MDPARMRGFISLLGSSLMAPESEQSSVLGCLPCTSQPYLVPCGQDPAGPVPAPHFRKTLF